MKKYNTRLDMIRELPAETVGVEVGVYRGGFSREILDLPNIKHLYLVDPWKKYEGYNDTINNEDQESNLRQTLQKVEREIPRARCSVLREFSAVAAKRELPLLDFAFIDGYHAYESALEDITLWSAKVKPDGCLMCHDYFSDVRRGSEGHSWSSGVPRAVEEFCAAHNWEISGITTGDDLPTVKLMRKK